MNAALVEEASAAAASLQEQSWTLVQAVSVFGTQQESGTTRTTNGQHRLLPV